jgi:hypothetical protein
MIRQYGTSSCNTSPIKGHEKKRKDFPFLLLLFLALAFSFVTGLSLVKALLLRYPS